VLLGFAHPHCTITAPIASRCASIRACHRQNSVRCLGDRRNTLWHSAVNQQLTPATPVTVTTGAAGNVPTGIQLAFHLECKCDADLEICTRQCGNIRWRWRNEQLGSRVKVKSAWSNRFCSFDLHNPKGAGWIRRCDAIWRHGPRHRAGAWGNGTNTRRHRTKLQR